MTRNLRTQMTLQMMKIKKIPRRFSQSVLLMTMRISSSVSSTFTEVSLNLRDTKIKD